MCACYQDIYIYAKLIIRVIHSPFLIKFTFIGSNTEVSVTTIDSCK